ncbi:MAG: ABC transporter permease [Chloroflexi bacterium]|nr:ABC transporter permease [Chloroflexota bacterium]
MRLFWELARRAFRRYMTYRAAAVAGLITNFFFGIFRVAVLLALFGSREEIGGITPDDAITYVGLTQAVVMYLSMFGWYDLIRSVHSGDVSSDLLKPMDYFLFWLAQDLGRAVVHFLLRGVLFMLLFELVYDLSYPDTAVHWLLVFVAVFLSWLLSFAYRFLINLAAFWTPNARGIARFGFVISWFFSGFMMPLRFFPEWVQRIAYFTPFPHLLNTVVEVYLGVLTGSELVSVLLIQLLWVVGLVVLGQVLLKTAVRRLVILGG